MIKVWHSAQCRHRPRVGEIGEAPANCSLYAADHITCSRGNRYLKAAPNARSQDI